MLPQQAAASAGLDQPAAATSVSVLDTLKSALGPGTTITLQQPSATERSGTPHARAAGCQVKVNYGLGYYTNSEKAQDAMNRPITKHQNNLNSYVSARGGWKDGVWGGIHYEDAKDNILLNYDIYEVTSCSPLKTPQNGLPLWAARLIGAAVGLIAAIALGVAVAAIPGGEVYATAISECALGFLFGFLVAGLTGGGWGASAASAIFGCLASVVRGWVGAGQLLRESATFTSLGAKLRTGISWSYSMIRGAAAAANDRAAQVAIEMANLARRCGAAFPTCVS